MMDRVQPSSEATPGVVAGISATPGDNQPSPARESAEVAKEGTDQQKADQASVQSPQDNMGQVKETEEQDTGTGETYQASVQSPQDIKEQRDETEQQDTRTGEAYQDAPAPDAPQGTAPFELILCEHKSTLLGTCLYGSLMYIF